MPSARTSTPATPRSRPCLRSWRYADGRGRRASQAPPPVFRCYVHETAWHDSDENLVDLLCTVAANYINQYRIAMNSSDIETGFAVSQELASIAATAASPEGKCQIVSKETGEVRVVDLHNPGFQKRLSLDVTMNKRLEWLL